MKKILYSKKIKSVFLILLIIFALISVMQGTRKAISLPSGSFDFQYDSAKFLALKIDPYTESLQPTGMQEKLGLYEYYSKLEANQFPSMLVFLIPFTFFEPPVANFLFAFFNLLCTAGILFLLWKMFCKDISPYLFAVIACIFLMGTPWRNNLGNGQHTIFSFFFFLLSIYLCERGKTIGSGVALAVSFFKYTLTVPMAVYYVYKKKYKELFIAVGIHVILTIASALWLNMSVLDMIILPLKVSSNLSNEGSFDIGSILHLGSLSMVVAVLLMVIVLIYALSGKFNGSDYEFLSLLTMVSLVVIYHREYDFFALIILLLTVGVRPQVSCKDRIVTGIVLNAVLYPFFISKVVFVLARPWLNVCNSIYAVVFYFSIIALFILLKDGALRKKEGVVC